MHILEFGDFKNSSSCVVRQDFMNIMASIEDSQLALCGAFDSKEPVFDIPRGISKTCLPTRQKSISKPIDRCPEDDAMLRVDCLQDRHVFLEWRAQTPVSLVFAV